MTPDTIIGQDHPHDGRDWDCQCARCGSTLEWVTCHSCGGDGRTAPGELYEEDPLWYDEDDSAPCPDCNGKAAWPRCISGEEWCEAHPIIGREAIPRNTPEWFVVTHQNPRQV